MSHCNLCAPCAKKREQIVMRTSEYAKSQRCDGCRRLTKTATFASIAAIEDAINQCEVVTYDDMVDTHFDMMGLLQ